MGWRDGESVRNSKTAIAFLWLWVRFSSNEPKEVKKKTDGAVTVTEPNDYFIRCVRKIEVIHIGELTTQSKPR